MMSSFEEWWDEKINTWGSGRRSSNMSDGWAPEEIAREAYRAGQAEMRERAMDRCCVYGGCKEGIAELPLEGDDAD